MARSACNSACVAPSIAKGRQYVDTALRRIDELTAEIDPCECN
jgi:hypothetical protein